jgi:hypothetical protein
MIVGCYFDGDENDTLKWVQHDEYGKMLWSLFDALASRYLLDIRYTWISPDFVPILRKIKNYDHRVLQVAHDLIAAYYRFTFCNRVDNVIIPEGFDIKDYYLAAWRAYYIQEVNLLSQLEEIAESLVTAVAYQNTDRGYQAEDNLRVLLLKRYKVLNSRE